MALFPLVFNLSFAQEVEVNPEKNELSWTESVVPESDTLIDSSLRSEWRIWWEEDSSEQAPQNDSLLSSWTEGEGSYTENSQPLRSKFFQKGIQSNEDEELDLLEDDLDEEPKPD